MRQKVILQTGRSIPTELTRAWTTLLASDPTLDSPYLRPEFTQHVASVRKDVEVGVVVEADRPVAFLPFQRRPHGVGRAVAGRLCDVQAVVGHRDVSLSSPDLVRGCGLSELRIEHLPETQTLFTSVPIAEEQFASIDLAGGFECYDAERREASKEIRRLDGKVRRLERDIGPLRLELRTTRDDAMQTLVEWKSEQYRRTGLADVFSYGWTLELLRRLLERGTPALTGVLSSLHAGDRLIGVHYGLRSHHVLHAWFPAYAPDIAKHSPGMLMFRELARAAAADGITRIDLGHGGERFKRKFANRWTALREGTITVDRWRRLCHGVWNYARRTARRSMLRPLLERPARLVHQIVEHDDFR